METNERKRKEFEYIEVITDVNKKSFLLEGYESFGWELEECISVDNEFTQYQTKIVLRLKRSPKIINKMELTRLQRKFEACVNELERLEKSKTLTANMYSLAIGIIGTGFLAGAVLFLTNQQMALGILFLIPSVLGWTLPIFVYKREVMKKTEKMNPFIEEKYNEIFEACEKGKRLLYREVLN